MRYRANFTTDAGKLSVDLNNNFYNFNANGYCYSIEKELFEEAMKKINKGEFRYRAAKCLLPKPAKVKKTVKKATKAKTK